MTLNHQLLRVTAGAAIMLSLLSAEKVQAASFQFTKLVDSNTAIPGGIGNFTSFLGASIDDGNVAFRGVGSTYQVGIFTLIDGSLNTVAYKNPNVPDTIKYYGTFTDPSFDDGNIAFIDINSSGQSSALYTNTGGALRVVVDQNTAVPGGTGNFLAFSQPSINNGSIVFTGNDASGQEGVYIETEGSFNVVANRNTLIPGGNGTFDYFSSPLLDKGNVAFIGADYSDVPEGQSGIYTNVDGSLKAVVDQNTTIPGGTGSFDFFSFSSDLAFSNGNVAFVGSGFNQEGVYTNIGNSLNVIADRNTPIPGGTGNFEDLYAPALDDENVAFLGTNSDYSNFERGIYTNLGGSLTKVIKTNDMLDGKVVSSFDFKREGLSGNSIVFTAFFSDSSRGIYRADLVTDPPQPVPEPSVNLGILLALAAFGAGLLVKGNRQ